MKIFLIQSLSLLPLLKNMEAGSIAPDIMVFDTWI